MFWPITIFVILVLFFGIVCFIFINKRHRLIRNSGEKVAAIVRDVRVWQEPSVQITMRIRATGSHLYEITAEWANPQTGDTYTFTSGVKRGIPAYRIGDRIPAYIGPNGVYLDL